MAKKLIIVILILAALAYIVRGCLKSDEDKIRDMLAESKTWAEKKDLLNLFNHFDKTFADDSGLFWEDLKMISFRVFQQCEKALLMVDIFLYLTESGKHREVFKPIRNTNRFKVKLSKKEGKWKFIESIIPKEIN